MPPWPLRHGVSSSVRFHRECGLRRSPADQGSLAGKRPRLSVVRQCTLLQLNRSGVYYRPMPESDANLALMRLIDAQFLETPYYGSRQMTRHLKRLGHDVGRKRVRRLMATMGLRAIYQKPRTAIPHPAHRKYPYLLRDLMIDCPNQVWCPDITYIPMRKGFLYLVAIMDWATRKVLSWRLSNTMDAEFCIEALQEALTLRCAGDLQHGPGLAIHDDPLHGSAGSTRDPHQHGRTRSMARQRLHRAAVAIPEIRMRLSASLRDRIGTAGRAHFMDRALQREASAFGTGWTHVR